MNRLLKLLGIGTVLTGYGITTVFGGKKGDGKNNKNPEEQTPSNQITSPFPQVNAFPQTTQSNPYQQANPFQPTNPFPQPQFPQPSSFPQATPPNPFQPSTYPPLPPRPAFKSQNQQPSSFPQTTPPPSSSLAPAEKGQRPDNQDNINEKERITTVLSFFHETMIIRGINNDILHEINTKRGVYCVYKTLEKKAREIGFNSIDECLEAYGSDSSSSESSSSEESDE